jgi:hypothetical protein
MNTLLESVLSLTYLYVLVSLLVSFLSETWNSFLRSRELTLKDSIDRLLNDPQNKNYGVLLYEHPLVNKLRKNEKRFPRYIGSRTFSKALVEVVKSEVETPVLHRTTSGEFIEEPISFGGDFEAFKEGVKSMSRSELRRQLEAFISDCEGSIEKVRANIEEWFDEYQSSVSLRYQRRTKKSVFVIALLTVLVLNFDSIYIFKEVQRNEVLRLSLVSAGEGLVENNQGGASDIDRKELNTKLKEYVFPLGWLEFNEDSATEGMSGYIRRNFREKNQSVWVTILGWLISTIALSFGAPFWFDILKRLVNVRGSAENSRK